ncbi:MAG TPA: hypothetical protein VIK60_01595 [Vicinamibacterales bacterium]
MSALETIDLASRLLCLSGAVLLLPGMMLLGALRVRADWHQRIVLAFALSYSWMFVLSVAIPLLGWSVDRAAVLTLVLFAIAAFALARARMHASITVVRNGDPVEKLLIGLVVVIVAAAGWVIEPPFTGDEALDLASISRVADGGPISFENTSVLPDTRPVYLFQPYQMAVGLIARWSGTDPMVALVKLRAFLAPLALALVYGLLRALTLTRAEAGAAFVVVLLFVALDINTWEWNSLFPFVRRGAVTAGICVPALLVLCHLGTRRAADADAVRTRRIALLAAPVMLVASLATHPLELFPLAFFAAGMVFAVLAGLDQAGARRPAVVLMILLAAATAAYVTLQARAVPYVAEFDRDDKRTLRAELMQVVRQPLEAIAGGPTEAREILSRTIPATTAVVAGIPAMALVALRNPPAAALLAMGIMPLALLYASPAGFLVLTLLTAPETVRNVNGYFGLLGVVGLALGLTSLAVVALHAARWRQNGLARVVSTSAVGSLVLWPASTWGRQAVQWLAGRTVAQPELLLLLAVATSLLVMAVAARRTRAMPPARLGVAVVLATACLAVPFALPEWGFGGVFSTREAVTAVDRFERALASPTVLDWPIYYEQLKVSIQPPLPVPRAVIDELRRVLEPRQVVLADPRYSCALVVLIDAYCINPEAIYGHYFQPAARYHTEYVTLGDSGVPEHPFYNASTLLSNAEERLLREYRVSYLLTDPAYAEQTAAKLRELGTEATLEMDLDGYRLYRIGAS